MVRWPVQPDEELAGLVPDMALHRRRHRWRRHGHRAASSPSPPTAVVTSTTKKRHIRDILGRTKKNCHTYDTSTTIIVTKHGIIIDVVGSYFYDKKS